MIVVDLRDWLLPSGHLAPDVPLAPHCARVVECATATISDAPTAMICRHDRGRRLSSAYLRITRDEHDAIHWRCPACDDAGVVTRWQGTM